MSSIFNATLNIVLLAFAPEIKVKARKMELFLKMMDLPEFIAASPTRGAFDSGAQYFSPKSIGKNAQVNRSYPYAYIKSERTFFQFVVSEGGKSSVTIRLAGTAQLNPECVINHVLFLIIRLNFFQGF